MIISLDKKYQFSFLAMILALTLPLFLNTGCSATADLTGVESLEEADISPEELSSLIPDYHDRLLTISGSGRAIVSEPGNSERVSVQFQSNRDESFIQVRNSAGIEGGQIFVDRDSLMVYNRLDKKAEIIPLQHGNLTSVGSLASVNMLDLFNYRVDPESIDRIYKDNGFYVLLLSNQTLVRISATEGTIHSVVHANDNQTESYSRLEYEGYAVIEQLILPRRITIYSKDGRSRATLLVQRLEINPRLPPLEIDLPEDIPVYRL